MSGRWLPVGGVPGVRVSLRMTARADTYTGDDYDMTLCTA